MTMQKFTTQLRVRHYEIRLLGEENLVVKAEALWVWVDVATMRPRPIPADLLAAFLHNTKL
jgi:acyl-CoA thioester hydrolase